MAKAAVVLEIGANDKGLVNAMRRSERQVEALQNKLKSAGRTGKRSGVATADGWVRAAAQMVTVGAGIRAVVAGLRDVEKLADSAAARIKSVADSKKDLIQLSSGPQDFIARQTVNRQLRTELGFSEEAADKFSFKITSAGLPLAEVGEAGRLRKAESDPVALAAAAVKIRNLFGQGVFGGTLTSVASTLGVAGTTSDLTAAGVAKLAISPLQFGAEVGFEPEAVLGGTSFATLGAGDPSVGVNRLAAFIDTLRKAPTTTKGVHDFRNLGFEAGLDKFFDLPEADRNLILGGRKEAVLGAASVSSGRERIREITANVIAETRKPIDESFFRRKERLADTDPRLVSTLAVERATQRQQIAEEPLGIRELIFDAIKAEFQAVQAELGRGAISRTFAGAVMGVGDLFNVSPETQAGEAAFLATGQAKGPEFEAFLARFLAVVEESTKALSRMNKAADQVGGGVGLRPSNQD